MARRSYWQGLLLVIALGTHPQGLVAQTLTTGSFGSAGGQASTTSGAQLSGSLMTTPSGTMSGASGGATVGAGAIVGNAQPVLPTTPGASAPPPVLPGAFGGGGGGCARGPAGSAGALWLCLAYLAGRARRPRAAA